MKKFLIVSLVIIILAAAIVLMQMSLNAQNRKQNTRGQEIGALVNAVADRVVKDLYPYTTGVSLPYRLSVWYEKNRGSVNYLWEDENGSMAQEKLGNTLGLSFPVNAHNQAEVFSWVKPDTEFSISRIEVREGTEAFIYGIEINAGKKYFKTIYLTRSCPEDRWQIKNEEWAKENI